MTTPIEDGPSAEQVERDHVAAVAGIPDARTVNSIKLTNHVLGLDPYVLIRAVKAEPDDAGDDGLRLKVEHNDDGASLAALYLLNLPAESNPLTAAIKAVIDANPDEHAVPEVLAMFAEFCGIPMPESGR